MKSPKQATMMRDSQGKLHIDTTTKLCVNEKLWFPEKKKKKNKIKKTPPGREEPSCIAYWGQPWVRKLVATYGEVLDEAMVSGGRVAILTSLSFQVEDKAGKESA